MGLPVVVAGSANDGAAPEAAHAAATSPLDWINLRREKASFIGETPRVPGNLVCSSSVLHRPFSKHSAILSCVRDAAPSRSHTPGPTSSSPQYRSESSRLWDPA